MNMQRPDSCWPNIVVRFLFFSLLIGIACNSSSKILSRTSEEPRGFPPPLDRQRVQDQEEMTWSDYHPIPGARWSDPALSASKKSFKIALLAVDFPDQPFVVTLPKHSDLFGNPQIDPVPREKVPQFYADFYNKPSALNHGQ